MAKVQLIPTAGIECEPTSPDVLCDEVEAAIKALLDGHLPVPDPSESTGEERARVRALRREATRQIRCRYYCEPGVEPTRRIANVGNEVPFAGEGHPDPCTGDTSAVIAKIDAFLSQVARGYL